MALKRLLTGFRRDERGATVVLYALSAVPLTIVIAATIDYARVANFRTGMQRGVDSAAILLAKQPASMTDPQLQTRGRPMFEAQIASGHGYATTSFTVVRSGKTIRVEARGSVQSSFGLILGRSTIDISAAADVASGNKKIELALALDNTGSMATQQKMQKLKQASNLLLDKLQAAVTSPDDVKVTIVPFDTQVRMPTSVVAAPPAWIRFAPTDPASGGARPTNWEGCVTDRSQNFNYDVTDAAPSSALPDSLYLAAQCPSNSLARILPLTNNFAAMRATIASMQPSGCTNVTIGAAWGLAALSSSDPLSGAAPLGDPDVQKIMVILTDGLNTQNRLVNACSGGGSAFAIDARTSRACDSILGAATPATRIRTYAIRVIEGNETLLRNCAGNGGSYYNVQNPNDLDAVFQSIADEITRIRLTS
jgi:Flp pilus assembly pilin Flp/Mg-chelatase subunit ChlD